MRRRDFVTGIAGSAAGMFAWPLAARAQQQPLPIVGYLSSFSANANYNAGFNAGLKELGFVDGQNVAIDYRYAEGHYDRLPELAADLVGRRVAAIFATGSNGPALAAKAATTTIPIVFVSGGSDPVRDGLVASINRPGGNVTGVSIINTALLAKRFEMLHQLVPDAATIGVLVNPNYPDAELQLREMQAAAVAIQRKIVVANARTEDDLDAAFAALVKQGANAFFTSNDPYFNSLRVHIVTLAARYALPAAYFSSAFPAVGGLMSYGADVAEAYRQGGAYIGHILKGETPADLPVMQSSKFELIINLKTAKTLGLTVPQSLLATADEVIE
jgi:putative tryptophan/tyrosine transport system substrate-binding protein